MMIYTHNDNLTVKENEILKIESDTISGSINLKKGAALIAPNLIGIGGDINMDCNAILEAPNLSLVDGCISMQANSKFNAGLDISKLSRVNGGVYLEKILYLISLYLVKLDGMLVYRKKQSLMLQNLVK